MRTTTLAFIAWLIGTAISLGGAYLVATTYADATTAGFDLAIAQLEDAS
jgi:hypothetical protein